MRLFILTCLICASALGAQYTVQPLNKPYEDILYSTFTNQELIRGGADDNALEVRIPFEFPYFGRAYRTCWMGTNGRISFTPENALDASIAPLASPTPAQFNTIHVFSCDLVAGERNPYAMLSEADGKHIRLVWYRMSAAGLSGLTQVRFAATLYSDGRIDFYYGKESTASGFVETWPFVSGLLNEDGTQDAPGFGATTALQTARPTPSAIRFFPTFTPPPVSPNEVRIQHVKVKEAPRAVAGTLRVPVLAFALQPLGAGGNVDTLALRTPDAAGQNVAFDLVEDVLPLGEFDGESSLGLGVTVGDVTTFSGLSLNISSARNFLVLAHVIGLTRLCEGTVFTLPLSCVAGVPMQGGAAGPPFRFAPGPIVLGHASSGEPGRIFDASKPNIPVLSFMLRLDADFGPASADTLFFSLSVGGTITFADITRVALYADKGSDGIIKPDKETLLGETTGAAGFSFSGLNTGFKAYGAALLLCITLDPAFAGDGTAQAALTSAIYAPASTTFPGVLGPVVRITGNDPSIVLAPNTIGRLEELPIRPGLSDLPACAFSLRASGSPQIMQTLRFDLLSGNIADISRARLCVDGGYRGIVDAKDTLVSDTPAMGASDVTFTFPANWLLDTVETFFVFAVNTNTTPTSPLQFALSTSGVTGAALTRGSTVTGTLVVFSGSAPDGVDVMVRVFADNVFEQAVDALSPVVIAMVECRARGAGGVPPDVLFDIASAYGGAGAAGGLAWAVNEFDGTQKVPQGDYPFAVRQLNADGMLPFAASNQIYLTPTHDPVMTPGSVRTFQIVVRRENLLSPLGHVALAFRGLRGGSDVSVIWGKPSLGPGPVDGARAPRLVLVNQIEYGKFNYCSTGEEASAALALVAALSALIAATRLRVMRRF